MEAAEVVKVSGDIGPGASYGERKQAKGVSYAQYI
jgi:hypothetical protein